MEIAYYRKDESAWQQNLRKYFDLYKMKTKMILSKNHMQFAIKLD